ncbi:AAWKG family protein [Streptomyces fragilis]|uniref:AAWKG family protein n=1 Tax=Streptomyces fragilis TaxID=67301 RepID=A0ABV2YMW1_9ACTN|nr:AAWKG family protein [Streptomyces fragilis]
MAEDAVPEQHVRALDADNDSWQKAAYWFTGYDAPHRDTLFESLIGNDGIPQMKVELTRQNYVDYVDPNDFNWRVENAGYRIENTDFVIPFYTTGGDDASAGDQVSMYKARITMLGNKGDDGPSGGVVEGGEFKSQYDNHLGLSGDKATWSTEKLTQYAYGTGRAMEALLYNENGTVGFRWNNKNVLDAGAVSLKSFDTAAAAFDRVAQFFANQEKVVAEWQRRVGTEQDDAWRGQAAGVFWTLIDTINRQYKGFADDMGAANGLSKQGNILREARGAFRDAVVELHRSWMTWVTKHSNPLIALNKLLVDITDHVWENNIKQITYKVNSSGGPYATYYTTYHAKAGFDQTATRHGKSDNFGPLDELSTWKAVGERAVQHWQAYVIRDLVEPAETALKAIHNSWSPTTIDLGSVRVRGESDLTSSYKEDLAEKQADDAKKAAAEAQRKQDEFIQWQKDQAAAAKAEQERKEKEAEAKAAAAKAEQERKEAEAKAEQERKEAEAKAEQERKEKEAEAKQAEAEAKAEQKQAEAEARQEQKEKEAEAKQAEAEAKAEQLRAEQEAKQEEAQKKQEEAQARAEQMQLSQFNLTRADQEKARQEQERKQAEAEAEADAKEAEAEAEQAEKEAEAERKQAEAEAKQEQKEKEAERKQAEAEAKAEEQMRQQEEEQNRLRTEQELRQEQLLTEQEKQEAERQARQEEAQQRQEEAYQQAQAAYERQSEGLLNPGGGLPGSVGDLHPGGVQLGSGDLNLGDLGSLRPDGLASNPYSEDGTLTNPGGSRTTLDDSGRLVTEHPDGSRVQIDPDNRTATITRPDGTVETGPLNIGDLLPNPDGSTTHLDRNGDIVTEYPDGTVTRVDPDTGIGTTTRPDGTVTTGSLNGSLGDLPSLSGTGSSLPSSFASPSFASPSYDFGSYEEELYDESPYESPYASPATPAMTAAQREAESGIPLNTGSLPGGLGMSGMNGTGGMPMGGMPMGGMPMGGAGAGNQSESERVRNVIDSGQPLNSRGGRPGAVPAARSVQGENDVRVSPARASAATTSGSPFLPMGGTPGGPGGRPQTESGDRAREVWAEDDDDVWGTDEGGAPAVIGR